MCFGPATNLAFTYKVNPEIANVVTNVVLCGGCHHAFGTVNYGSDFNFYYDAEAVKNVFGQYKKVYLVPVEPVFDFYLTDSIVASISDSKYKYIH